MNSVFTTLGQQAPDTLDHGDRWRDAAACLEEDPELFFPVGTSDPAVMQAEEAKAVCRRCPVVEACLQWALETRQDSGIWGGLDELERHNRNRRRARAAGKAKTLTTTTECGTRKAYYQHVMTGSPVDTACQAAFDADEQLTERSAA